MFTPPYLWPARSAKPFDRKNKIRPALPTREPAQRKNQPCALARAERKPLDHKIKLTPRQKRTSSLYRPEK